MSRWKVVPWLLGVAVLAFTLVAARLNTPAPSAHPDKPVPASAAGEGTGPTVIGTVDAPDGVLPIHPPGVPGMAALTVKRVGVKGGSVVAPGDVLVEFDASTFLAKKAEAEHGVVAAEWLADLAKKQLDDHATEVERAKLGVRKAEGDVAAAEKRQKVVVDTLEENLAIATQSATDRTPLTEAQKELRRARSGELLAANDAVRLANVALDAARIDQQKAERGARLLEGKMNAANVEVARLKEQVAGAAAVLEAFKLKAQVAGTVEQVTVAEGVSVGPATRTPMMYLVPSGPRVVRAEVEPEFAHKIDGFLGKPVTIRAGANYADTYAGVARRASGAFLPKRFGSDGLVGAPGRALECVIDITDPAPAGKPPLRPGQPVRVTFGP